MTSIQLSENVAFWHYAHSYVRGHPTFRVPWLLQKSCHDLDLLQWLAGSKAAEVTSFIRPTELTEVNARRHRRSTARRVAATPGPVPTDAVTTYRDLAGVVGPRHVRASARASDGARLRRPRCRSSSART
ncbi:MAG: hypothetical protein R2789_00040 [Microthrixaceae bacterium]